MSNHAEGGPSLMDYILGPGSERKVALAAVRYCIMCDRADVVAQLDRLCPGWAKGAIGDDVVLAASSAASGMANVRAVLAGDAIVEEEVRNTAQSAAAVADALKAHVLRVRVEDDQ